MSETQSFDSPEIVSNEGIPSAQEAKGNGKGDLAIPGKEAQVIRVEKLGNGLLKVVASVAGTMVILLLSSVDADGQITAPDFAGLDTLCANTIHNIYIEDGETLWLYNTDDKFTFTSRNGGSGGDGFSATNNTGEQQIIEAEENDGESGSSQIDITSSDDWVNNEYPFESINETEGSCADLGIEEGPASAEQIRSHHASIKRQTFSEKNNEGFYVRKSGDGLDWEDVAYMPSQSIGGNSDVALNYEVIDKECNNLTYYEISDEDLDGAKNQRGDLLSVQCDINEKIKFGPNPANSYIKLDIESDEDITYQISITDILGRQQHNGDKIDSNSSKRVDVSSLAPGVYNVFLSPLLPENWNGPQIKPKAFRLMKQ